MCNILQNDEAICTVASTDYNNEIASQESISLGYCAEGSNRDIINLQATSSLVEETKDDIISVMTEVYTYEYETFSVEYQIENVWEENCNVCVRVTNTSDTDIENWKLVWESEDILSNVYNAEMSCEEGIYTFKNLGYNQDILAGESIEFGFDVCYGAEFDVPKGFVMSYAETDIAGDNYTFKNIITNAWDSGYTGELHLTNVGSTVIEDWYLTIQSENVITNIWIGTLTDWGNGMYGIKNPQHHQNLQPGGTIVIGFQANGSSEGSIIPVLLSASEDAAGGEGTVPEASATPAPSEAPVPSATSVPSETPTPSEAPTLKENYIEVQADLGEVVVDEAINVEEEVTSYYGIVNNLHCVERVEYQVTDAFENQVLSGKLTYDKLDGTWSIENFGLVIGWNDITFQIYLEDGSVVNETFSYLNSAYENMEKTNVDLQDTDGDGINNYFELVCGTSLESDDIDGDNMSDFEELMIVGTDPAQYDTDMNGTSDADEDFDADGLTNLEELVYGTSPSYGDSDLDDIDDKTEIIELGTDPLKEDTDEDGLTDGEEIKLGTNPLVKDTDEDGTDDSDEKIEQETSLILEEAEGLYAKYLSV